MYRLLRRYSLPVHNIQLPTIQINANKNSKVCSFCSFYHLKPFKSGSCLSVYQKDVSPGRSYSAIRHQTTSASTAIMDERPPKKIKHRMGNYAELLEVSGETTSNKKAKIKKLNASSVSKFANEPEISLDQLHKIRNKSKSQTSVVASPQDVGQTESTDFQVYDAQEEMNLLASASSSKGNTPVEDEATLHEDLMVLEPDPSMMIKNASVLSTLEEYSENIIDEGKLDAMGTALTKSEKLAEQKVKSQLKTKRKSEAVEVKTVELEMQYKKKSLERNLSSYLNVCVNSGMMAQGLSTLIFYRHRGKSIKNHPPVVGVRVYNIILHGYASIANTNKVKEILEIMAEDSIKPDPQTYAAIFECFGRNKTSRDFAEFLNTIAAEMTENGISFNDVLNESVFTHDQREMVNRGIHRINPNFQASYTPPKTSYTNHLLHKITKSTRTPTAPAKGLFTAAEIAQRGREQMRLEQQGRITVKSIAANGEITRMTLHCRQRITESEEMWKNVIREALERDTNVLKVQYSGSSYQHRAMNIYPYLKVLAVEHYVDAISNEIKLLATGSETFSPSLNILTRQLGQNIFHRYVVETKKKNGVCDKISEIYEQYCYRYLYGHKGMNTRTIWQNLLHEQQTNGPTADLEITPWPPHIVMNIGKFLYNILLRDIKIDANSTKMTNNSPRYLPAFYAVFRSNRHKLTQEIKPHPTLCRLYRDAQLETLTFEPVLLPSLSPPVPWYSIRNGGYLISDAKIIRLSYQATHQWQMLEEVPPQQLYPVLDSLNQLGSIPWKVNGPVLDVALKVFQGGGSKILDIPEPPSHPLPYIPLDANASKEERNRVAKARLKEKRKKGDMYSLWCEAHYRLSLAAHYRDQTFWLPHSMDFRGRVYPIPPHVNHLGSDMARSLMVFALGKPLGPDGLDWLKIHIINLTGLKKREANSERLKYANEMLPKILDSAENPLDGEKWWQESEEPWQTLAACFEIAKAIKSPNPVEYVSHFPIHQDGSCNGLQHYAALGRDQQGAESVNLYPAEKPQDVYSSIAALVERERKNDAENGTSIAIALEGLIKRKVIKQTVMTTVYGVTRFGARLQIARQLKEIEFPDELLWQGSHYLVNKTFLSLREMFTSTKLIQDWLTDSARLVSMVCGQNMEWVTPLGLPVVQPYTKIPPHNDVKPFLASEMNNKPNVMKQKNAFPPNFIHSLDSSHMMLTSLHCENAGLTFVSVHDCFWTHPSTVAEMNRICREEFVALHSEPILENLSKFLNSKFGFKDSELRDDGSRVDLTRTKLNNVLNHVPKQGVFDLKNVIKSVYFFS